MKIPSGTTSRPHRLTCPLCERDVLDLLGTGFARCGRCGLPLVSSALETLRDIIGRPDVLVSRRRGQGVPRLLACATDVPPSHRIATGHKHPDKARESRSESVREHV